MNTHRARNTWLSLQALLWLSACASQPKPESDGPQPDAATSTGARTSAAPRRFDNSRERLGDLEPLPETSVSGEDADGDHIRDDVAAFIDAEYGNDERKRLMARQYARSVQHGLLYAGDEDRAFEAAHEGSRALRCLNQQLGVRAAEPIWQEVQARTIDTEERLRAHARLQGTLSGGYFPEPRGVVCAFDMEGLAP
jgi:hypothetical protein